MKTLIAMLLFVASGVAAADTYSQIIARKQFCSSMGSIAGLAYADRVKGTLKEDVLTKVASMLNQGGKAAEMLRFGINYAYSDATDQKDAHMKSWANCMDDTN